MPKAFKALAVRVISHFTIVPRHQPLPKKPENTFSAINRVETLSLYVYLICLAGAVFVALVIFFAMAMGRT